MPRAIPSALGTAVAELGHVQLAAGDMASAATLFDENLMLRQSMRDAPGIRHAFIGFSRLAVAAGQWAAAAECWEQ